MEGGILMFLNNLIQNLFKNDYKLFYKESDDISDLSTCFGFIKQVGGTAYIPIIINTECVRDYDARFKAVSNTLSKNQLIKSFSNIIFIGIFLTDKNIPQLIDYCVNNSVDFSENINYIKWCVNISEDKIICGKNQPDKVDVIRDCIINSFADFNEDISDINSAYVNAKEENAKKIKSSNIMLTIAIIIINFIVMIILELNGGSTNSETLYKFGAIQGYSIYALKQYYRLFTHIFIHIGWMHFLSNSLSLYIFGSRVEKYYGKLKFIIIYVCSGILGGIFASLSDSSLAAGASGAIFGLTGAVYGYIYLNKASMAGFDKYIINLFTIISIGTGFVISGVSNAAHIGGFISGLLLAFIMNRISTD